MKRPVWIILMFVASLHVSRAQENDSITLKGPIDLIYQSTIAGIGRSSVYDTYISPINYGGYNLGIQDERMRNTGLFKRHIVSQQLFNIDFFKTKNNAENADSYSGFLEYNYGMFYRFKPIAERLQFFAGPQLGGKVGFIYNSRNTNNPAVGKAHLSLNLSGIAAYRLDIGKQPIRLRYQFYVPCIGMLFSQQYGQSYYEISIGESNRLLNFSSFNNYLDMKNILTVEIPLKSITFRTSYINSMYETKINGIHTRIHSNGLFIGFSKDFFVLSGKKSLNRGINRIFK